MQTIKNTLAENFGGPGHDAASDSGKFSLNDVPDLKGKVAVVTGGSEGIGYGSTHTLLTHNISKLYILSRNTDKVDDALSAISSELGSATAQKVRFLQCDLTKWAEVTKVASEISKDTDRLDILINNAARGIMTRELTDYNIDQHFALNHVGHVVLTSHLLPLLKKTASDGHTVRIVILGSNAHQGAPSDCKFASIEEINTDLGPNEQYGRTKLAQMLYARYLATHLNKSHPKILANCVHPGFVATPQSTVHIHEAYPLMGYAMSVGMQPFKKNQFEGCVSAMWAATKTEGNGEYICPPAIVEPGSKLYQDDALMEQVMKLTTEVVKDRMFNESVGQGCPLELY